MQDGFGGIAQTSTNSTLKNCYYLNSSASQGIYNQSDIRGQVESRTQEEMQSEQFVKLLNINKSSVNSEFILFNWQHVTNSYPTLEQIEFKKGKELVITNVKEKDNLIISKIDKDTGKKLAGAKFRLENATSKANLIGDIESNSQYKFSKYGVSGYQSDNYNVSNSVANAYFPIDLRVYDGTFNLKVNYTISSQSNYDYGYATITTSPDVPTYDQNDGNNNIKRFIYTSGSYSNLTSSISLTGGQKYYLHIGYRKDGSTNINNDRFYINSMDLTYSAEVETNGDGIASVKVPTGVYTITEIKAPLEYELNSSPQTLEIFNFSQVNELTFENTKEESNFDKPNFILTKRDKVTDEVMPGVKFMVLDEQGNYAKDYTGTFVGEKEEIDGQEKYVVTTDINGQIKLRLKMGNYKLVEVKTLEGYALDKSEELRTIHFRPEADIKIEYIEDLVSLSNSINSGEMSKNYINVELTRSLDFNDDSCYRDASDTETFGDYNGDGNIQSIKEELTNTEGTGFKPIGTNEHQFMGTFDGKDYEIKNIYINSSSYSGLFGYIYNSIIANVKINGNISCNSYNATGSIAGYVKESKIIDCHNKATIKGSGSYSGYNTTGGIIGFADNVVVMNCSNSGYVQGSGGIVGFAMDSSYASKIMNCLNTGTIQEGARATGGILGGESADIINCYNLGEIGTSGGSGGIAGWISQNNKISNCYNSGKVADGNYSGGIVGYDYDTEHVNISNCYYLDTTARKGIQGSDDIANRTDPKTEQEMKSELFVDLLNENKESIDEELSTWVHNEDSYPTFESKSNELNKYTTIGNVIVTNQKASKVVVHHYLEGTGKEFGNEAVVLAEDELLEGKIPDEYTTSPNMKIEGYTLIKDQKGEYVIPANASGTYKEEEQHVYYYYNRKPLELIVHHYLEGTEDSLADDEHYYYQVGEHYKTNASEEVLKSYELVEVVGDEEKDITKNEEVTYYYKIKKHEITTRVEVPEGREAKGGSISGEGMTPYETVDYGKTSVEDIVIKPDTGYRIKQIRLVSTNEEGVKQESIIYGENQTENAEITYKENVDNSLTLTKFENMTEDKEVIVVFEPDEGRLIVHHYIENTQEKIYDDQITVGMVGQKVETNPVKVENYVVVKEPADRKATITEETQEKVYYYQRQYKITTDVIEHDEKYKDGTVAKNVKGGSITSEDKAAHEYVLKGRASQNEIKIVPTKVKDENGKIIEEYEIVKVVIKDGKEDKVGKIYDFKDKLEDDGSLILKAGEDGIFPDMQSDKHVEVEFRKKTKVIVKHLEIGTEKVLYTTEDGKEYEEIVGYEGQEFETFRRVIANYKTSELGITDENKVAIEANGTMFADEITIIYWYEKVPSGILVKHVEKVTTKTINEETGKEEITVTGVVLDEEVIPGYAGNTETTKRKNFENYIPAENKDATEGINVGKDENSKTVTMKQDEVVEVVYWYEREFNITTNVREHTEKVINTETGKEETVKVKGGTISGEDETPYEKVVRSNDSTKEIKVVPDDGYKIKKVWVNGEEIYVEDKIAEDGSLVLDKFTNMQEDKLVEVEFEKIPAKIIVKYKDAYTKESVLEDKIVEGFVNDKYSESRVDIEGYIPSEPEPENSTGTMTKDVITITYWYTKQFNITTDVKEHEEKVTNAETGKEEIVKVKGGEIFGEDETPYEVVTRGETSTKQIIIKPEDGYRIKEVTINGKTIEIKDLIKEDNSIELPFFTNMQEHKHIVVEYEKIPATVKVQYLEEGTEKVIYKTEDGKEYEEIKGFVNDKYTTKEKDFEYYEFVKEKYPENSKGIMTEDEIIVKYYYKQIPFNMKVEKEIENIILNGQNVEVTDKNKAKVEIKYKDINQTKLEISYKIKVTNTEKIEGIAILEEILPEGFEFVIEESNAGFELETEELQKKYKLDSKNSEDEESSDSSKKSQNSKETKLAEKSDEAEVIKYILKTEILKPGETKEYKVTLRWKPDSANKGEKANIAKIAKTENTPEYEETTLEDNEDDAIIEIKLEKTLEDVINDIKDGKLDEVIDMPKTGQSRIIYIASALIAGTCVGIIVYRKKKGNNK